MCFGVASGLPGVECMLIGKKKSQVQCESESLCNYFNIEAKWGSVIFEENLAYKNLLLKSSSLR